MIVFEVMKILKLIVMWLTKNMQYVFLLLPLYIILYVGIGIGWGIPIGNPDRANRINLVLLNLSYSYVAAIIFSIIWEYLPQKNLEKKAYSIVKTQLESVLRDMSEIISALKMIYDIEMQTLEIKYKDLSCCDVYLPSYAKTYYKDLILQNGIERTAHKGIYYFWDDLEELSNKILRDISKIKGIPSSQNLNTKLLVLLSEIEQANILKGYIGYKKYPYLYNEHRELYGFSQKLYDFILLYNRLVEILGVKIERRKCKLTNDEIIAFNKERKVFIEKLKSEGRLPQDGMIYYNNIMYKIKDGVVL